jgi:hypothetical protein
MKRTATVSFVLVCLAALLLPVAAEARKPLKLDWRSLDRRFPSGWCPLVFPANLPEFKAEGSSATLRFVVDGRPGQRIDDVYVVEKSVYQANLVNDDNCGNGLVFNPGSGAPVAFFETFGSEANGWRPYLVSWGKGTDDGNGALFFQPTGLVAIVVSGLKKGTTYVVGASWYTDFENTEGAVLNIRVDPRGQLGCGTDSLVVQGAQSGLLTPDE